ncbi:MAG: hypothetical protein WC727_05315 [Ignavibacteriaceae bacterium]|jgi:hypothetical protein
MLNKTFILIISLLALNLFALMIFFWRFVKENQGPLMLITTFVLVVITGIYVFYTKELSESAQKQIQLQLEQFKLDNRPSVFISGWGEFQKFSDMQTIRFTLKNVGKLPAKFDTIEYKIIIGDKTIDIDSKDFSKPTVIFPSQENMHIDLPVPNVLFTDIKKNLGFYIKLQIIYYSINDIEKLNQFSYSIKYSLRMNNAKSETIDEYKLQEMNAN